MRGASARCTLVVVLILIALSGCSWAQLSGRLDLDLIARRIPTSLTGEIKLDTPSEFTMLEFAIGSKLDITMRAGFIDPRLLAAVNTAGIEHFVLLAPLTLGDLRIGDAQLGSLQVVPEIWVGVPFENVIDVNNLPNSVVIPPGDPLFVTGRVAFRASIGAFEVEHLVMLDDVNFPSPSGGYDPLTYERSDQAFDIGSLTIATWRASIGLAMQAEVGLSASAAGKNMKGHSKRGSVTPGESFLRIGVGGIRLGDTSLFNVGVQDVTLGTSFAVSTGTDARLSTTLSIAGSAWDGSRIGLTATLCPAPLAVSTFSLSIAEGPFLVGIALNELDVTGLSARLGTPLNLGPITGAWSLSATGLEQGLTGVMASLSLSHGVFSTRTSIGLSQVGEDFGFASWSSQLTFRFSPAVVSVQATFGRYGLTRAAVTTSMSF